MVPAEEPAAAAPVQVEAREAAGVTGGRVDELQQPQRVQDEVLGPERRERRQQLPRLPGGRAPVTPEGLSRAASFELWLGSAKAGKLST